MQATRARAIDPSSSNRGLKIVISIPTARPLPTASRIAASSSSQRKPSREPVVDCRHDGVVEDVAVDMDPEAVDLGPRQVLDSILGRALHAPLAHLGKIDHADCGVLDALASGLVGLLARRAGRTARRRRRGPTVLAHRCRSADPDHVR